MMTDLEGKSYQLMNRIGAAMKPHVTIRSDF